MQVITNSKKFRVRFFRICLIIITRAWPLCLKTEGARSVKKCLGYLCGLQIPRSLSDFLHSGCCARCVRNTSLSEPPFRTLALGSAASIAILDTFIQLKDGREFLFCSKRFQTVAAMRGTQQKTLLPALPRSSNLFAYEASKFQIMSRIFCLLCHATRC